jgi:hypothetical protein
MDAWVAAESESRRLHGLVIKSSVPLHAPVVEARADIIVRSEEFDREAPVGAHVVLVRDYGEDDWATITRTIDGFLINVTDMCWFLVADDLQMILQWADSDEGWAWLPIMLEGWVLAFVLEMQGACILHASAARVGEYSVAFAGDAGAGKTTLATMLALSGGEFLCDDLTRIDVRGCPPRVFRGSVSARLREQAAPLAQLSSQAFGEDTVDGRLSTSFGTSSDADSYCLDAILLPAPSREATRAKITWLEPKLALVALAQHPRIIGWTSHEPLRRRFELLGELVESVPVGDLEVPWGPPWTIDRIRGITAQIVNDLRERSR